MSDVGPHCLRRRSALLATSERRRSALLATAVRTASAGEANFQWVEFHYGE